jgi:hypothetical protein
VSICILTTPKNPETGKYRCGCCGNETADLENIAPGGLCWYCVFDEGEPCKHGKEFGADYDEYSEADEAGNPDPFIKDGDA